MSGRAVIVVDSVTVEYGETVALERVDLTLGRGVVCGLVGINGSGKSSLFKAIMGTVRLTGGSVIVDGRPAGESRSGSIGYVPQSEQVDWAFPINVFDVVMMGRYGRLGPSRRPGSRDRVAVSEALGRVGLDGLAGRQVGELSGGQRKRVFVARALAQGASIVLLDEPFAGVDAGSQASMSTILREIAEAGGTVLIATHDLRALPGLCDEVVLLRNRVLMHDRVELALEPENLTMAFGLDVTAQDGRGRGDAN